jgi:hypothetical protein
MPAPRGFWTDPDDAAEVSAALDDYADQLKESARTRRERAEVARFQGYATELREAHGIADPGPATAIRRVGGSGDRSEGVS